MSVGLERVTRVDVGNASGILEAVVIHRGKLDGVPCEVKFRMIMEDDTKSEITLEVKDADKWCVELLNAINMPQE